METDAREAAARCLSGSGGSVSRHASDGAVVVKLYLGHEVIDVRLDALGLHFSHPEGSATEGYLTWSTALALSLLPPGGAVTRV